MKNSIKQNIIRYLENNPGFQFGGKIDREVWSATGHKESNVSRQCRLMCHSGLLERQLVQIDGKGPRVVKYRLSEVKFPQAYQSNQVQLF